MTDVLWECMEIMKVDWDLRWGKAGARNLVFFRVKCTVASAGDLLCAMGAAAVVSRSNRFLVCVLQWVVVLMCAWFYAFVDSVVADRNVVAAWMLHGAGVGGEGGARNLMFFSVKCLRLARLAMEATSCVRRVRLRSFQGRIGSLSVFCNEWLFVCVWFYAFVDSLVADRHVMAAWMLHGACVGGKGGARNLVFFHCKVPSAGAAGDGSYLLCATGAAAVVSRLNRFLVCVLQWVVVHVCMILCVCWLCGCRSQCSGCMNVAWGLYWEESRSTKPCDFQCKVPSAGAAGDGSYLLCATGAAAVVSRSNRFLVCVLQWVVVLMCAWFYAFVDSVVADLIVMAASRLLGAAAACVILLSFAAGQRKSYCNGCIKAATMICQNFFSILTVLLFLFECPFKKCFEIVLFFAVTSRSGFGAAISELFARSYTLCCAIQSVQIAL